jgi:hypothetical protein
MGFFGGKKKKKSKEDEQQVDVNVTAVDVKQQLEDEIQKVKDKRNDLGNSIEHNESRRRRLMVKLEQLHAENMHFAERVAKRKQLKKEYEKTIKETQSANQQMHAETQALLHKLKMDMINADIDMDATQRRANLRKEKKMQERKNPITRELERQESSEFGSDGDDSSF